MKKNNIEYFNIADVGNKGFYQIPDNLFGNKHYQKQIKKYKKINHRDGTSETKEVITTVDLISDTSKLMYGVMLRYLNYSLTNGWFDKDKKVYILLSVATLAKLLNKSRDTIIKCKNQLEELGLLKIKKTKYSSDIFYLGKIKEKSENDIFIEIEDRIKETKNLGVESVDQSKVSYDPVESVDLHPVESVDCIKVESIKDSSKVEKEKTTATDEDIFNKNLKELLVKNKINIGHKQTLKKQTLKNIKNYSNKNIVEIEKAINYIKSKKKSLEPKILVSVLRDQDYKIVPTSENKSVTRIMKINHMKEITPQSDILTWCNNISKMFGFGNYETLGNTEKNIVEQDLGNLLCRKYNELEVG